MRFFTFEKDNETYSINLENIVLINSYVQNFRFYYIEFWDTQKCCACAEYFCKEDFDKAIEKLNLLIAS